MRQKIMMIVCAAFALALFSADVSAGTKDIDISGKWKLNEELSDNPGDVLAKRIETMQSSRPGKGNRQGAGRAGRGGRGGAGCKGGCKGACNGQGGPQAGGGRGQGQGGQHPSGGPGQHKAMVDRVQEMQKMLVDVQIKQDDGRVTVTAENGETFEVIPDGVVRNQQTPMGEANVSARWEDNELVTTWEPMARGPRVNRVFRINDDGQLEVEMRFVAGRSPEPVVFALVYDSK